MSFTLPTEQEFYDFWGDEADDVDDARATLLIQLAGDLLWLATDLDADPVDPRLARLVKSAICDMAIYLYVSRDDIDAEYSPLQSERIGSYNYSKAFSKIRSMVVWSEPTGAPIFDKVVAELLDELAYGNGTVVGGQAVFREVYVPLRFEAYGGSADLDAGLYR